VHKVVPGSATRTIEVCPLFLFTAGMPDGLQWLSLTWRPGGQPVDLTQLGRWTLIYGLRPIACAQERHPHELVPCGVAVLMDAKTALEEPQRVLEVGCTPLALAQAEGHGGRRPYGDSS